MAGLEIDVLGQFALRRDGVKVPVPSVRQRALLAALALRAGHTVPADVLALAVWGDDPPVHVRASLFTVVYRLRGLLGEGAVHTTSAGYLLDIPPGQVDALRFQGLLDDAFAAGRDEDAHRLLTQALELWRGAPLSDIGSAVTETRYADGLVERYLGAVEHLADVELRLRPGPYRELIARLRELTAAHPLRESLWRRLLAVLGAAGRQAEALEAYETVRRLLDEELGTLPSAELRALHEHLLREEPNTGPDAGRVPQELRVPRQLPPDLAVFVGRQRQLAALDAAADATRDPRRAAVAVVHGAGGIGKSSLAVHWAHRAAARFPGGHLHIDLRGYGPGSPLTAHHALGVLLAALGVHRDRIPAGTEERQTLWPEVLAGRGVLLVLDNALSVQQVRPLLPGPGGTAVITSRNRLSGLTIRDGARSVALPEMSDDEARRMLADALGTARAAAEPDAVARLARACGRLPLALRIVAELVSRHPDAPLAHFADEFAGGAGTAGLDALAVTDDPASDPRTVFSWSYRELNESEARLFRLFSLVPGGRAGAADAAALAGEDVPRVRAALAGLAALHLLEEETPGRYRAHDLLREYAAERAAEEDAPADQEAAVERLFGWYLHATLAAVRTVHPYWFTLAEPQGEPAAPVPDFAGNGARAGDWLAAWCPDLVAAVTHGAEHGRHAASAVLLADELRPYFWTSLRMSEWEPAAEAALRAADIHGDDAGRGAARLNLADFHAHANRAEPALALYRECSELAERAGRPDLLAACLNNLAGIHWRAGRLAESADCLSRGLALNQSRGRPIGQYNNRSNLATVCLRLGRAREAYGHLLKALELLDSVGIAEAAERRCHCMINLVAASYTLGRFEEALRYAEPALPLARAAKDVTWEADCLCYVADVHRDLGERDKALGYARTALSLARSTDDPVINAEARLAAGGVELRFGRPQAAQELYRQALALAIDHSLSNEHTAALIGTAATALALGRPAEATESVTVALGLARRHEYRGQEADALLVLARIGLHTDDPEAAVDPARLAVATYEAIHQPVGLARALSVLGRTRDPGAAEALRRGRALFAELGCPEPDGTDSLLNAPPGRG